MKGPDQQHRQQCRRQRHRGDAHGEQLLGLHRRAEDQLQVGARIKGAGDAFHRLGQHRRARQKNGGGDGDQSGRSGAIASRRRNCGSTDTPRHAAPMAKAASQTADPPLAVAPAGRHHRRAYRARPAALHGGQTRKETGRAHAAARSCSRSPRWRGTCLPDWLASRPMPVAQFRQRAFRDQAAVGDHADAVGHAFGDFQNMGGHHHACRRRGLSPSARP